MLPVVLNGEDEQTMPIKREIVPQRKLLPVSIKKTCLALGLMGHIVSFSASAANPIVRPSTHAFAFPDEVVEHLRVGPAITTIQGEKYLQFVIWERANVASSRYRNIIAGPLDKLFDRTIPWDDLVFSSRWFFFYPLGVNNNLVDLNNDGSNTLVYDGQEYDLNYPIVRLSDDIFNGTLTSSSPGSVEFVDVDGDGDLDVFMTGRKVHRRSELYENRGSPEVPYLINRGRFISIDDVMNQYLSTLPEGFLDYYIPMISRPFPSVYQFPLVYDFDSDGDLDVLIAGGATRKTLKYYEQSIQDGVPVFSEPFGVFPVGDGIASWVADFDEDGDYDLLVNTESDDLRYFERIGNNPVRFADPETLSVVSDLPNVRLETYGLEADLDGDGDVDTVNNQNIIWNLESSPGSITNFSTRSYVGQDSNVLIVGFIIEGQSPQTVILRGIGPSLADKGVSAPLEDPHIYLFSGDRLIAHNDDWQTTKGAGKIESAGIGLEHPKESALRVRLDPGVYTVHLKGKSGETGMGIIGVDADNQMPTNSLQVNISGRALVGEGEAITIGGFVIEGDTPVKVLIRGLGPQLRDKGVSNALSDPNIILYSGSRIIGSNNDWRHNANVSEIAILDNAPTHDKESAILSELAPGTYTVHLKGGQGELGVGIIAIDRL